MPTNNSKIFLGIFLSLYTLNSTKIYPLYVDLFVTLRHFMWNFCALVENLYNSLKFTLYIYIYIYIYVYIYILYDYVLCHILSSSDLTYEYMEWNKYVRIFCSLFDDTFSVTRLHSVDDRVTSEWWWWIDEDIHALSRIQTRGLSVQAIKVYACSREATGTGSLCVCM
jgi:hypothetical protein